MSKTIWEFPLALTDEQVLDMRQDASVLSAGLDPMGQLCVWALVEPELGTLPVRARIVGTGHWSPGRGPGPLALRRQRHARLVRLARVRGGRMSREQFEQVLKLVPMIVFVDPAKFLATLPKETE
jgi:hypothetical protein